MSNTVFGNNLRGSVGALRPTMLKDGLIVNGQIKARNLFEQWPDMDKPQTIDIKFAQLFSSSEKYHGKPMIGMTEAKGKKRMIDGSTYRWELMGGNTEVARVTRVICTDPRPGIGLGKIDIVLDRDWFSVSEVIQPAANQFQFRVTTSDSNPSSRQVRQLSANEYQYTIQMLTDDPTAYCDPEFLQVGAEWTRMSSAVADEGNFDGGGFSFLSVFESRGKTQQFSRKFEISDKAARRIKQDMKNKGMCATPEDRRYTQTLYFYMGKDKNDIQQRERWDFMSVLESKALDQLYQDVENAMVYGRESTTQTAPEGYKLTTFAGLRQQLESSHKLIHDGFLTLEELEYWFDGIIRDKISYGNQKIVLSCGTEFAKMFDRMVKLDSKTFITIDSLFIRSGEDKDKYRHLDYGSYFSTFKGFRMDISVLINESYDNRALCPERHPVKVDTAIDSWRADILDFGSTSAATTIDTDNIMMISESYCDYNITFHGKWKPSGKLDAATALPIADGGMGVAGGVLGYSRLFEKNAGLMIADITRCGMIKMASRYPEY